MALHLHWPPPCGPDTVALDLDLAAEGEALARKIAAAPQHMTLLVSYHSPGWWDWWVKFCDQADGQGRAHSFRAAIAAALLAIEEPQS